MKEIYDGAITPDHANYLRSRYLWGHWQDEEEN